MPSEQYLTQLARTIQLSVAPVFLLTAIGTMLGVLTNRLSRIVDRARVLEGRMSSATAEEEAEIHRKLSSLSLRARLINLAITLGTVCALLICLMIASMFLGVLLSFDLHVMVALLFVAAMFAFIGTLLTFLREIFVAVKTLRIGMQ